MILRDSGVSSPNTMKPFSAILFLILALPLAGEPLPDVVDFNDHIQPIISEKCYHCHGPDSSTRAPKKNPLRLDREEFAFLERPSGNPAIIKGDSEASEVFKRVISKDVDDVMPPPDSHKKPLNPREVELIKKWIDQGAKYEEHWSFTPLTRPETPANDWGNNPIDRFIAAQHRAKGLTPNPQQDASRLLRRLTFDLTGLPPTPDEVAAFREMAAKDLPTAVELTTGKLLTTDAYAEHFARHWLDAARYADTHGIHIDNYRNIWPYRDWVIESFRQNMPYDKFTREQIAGDLLPNPTLDQRIATGFNRCLPTTGEGGAIEKEYEAIYAADQVSTTSAIWLGLSTGCAACHDHKFDPISQKDFYALTAFFRNTTMKAMDGNRADHAPVVFAPRREDRARFAELEKEIPKIAQSLTDRRLAAQPDFQAWLANQTVQPIPPSPLKADFSPTHLLMPDDELGSHHTVENINLEQADPGQFQTKDQVTFTGFIYLDGPANGSIISRLDTTSDHRGWDLWLEDGKIGTHFIDTWPKKAIKATTTGALPQREWLHFAVIYDGKARRANQTISIFINGQSVPVTHTHSGKLNTIDTKVPTLVGARHPDERLTGKVRLRHFGIFKRKLSPQDIEKEAAPSALSRLLAVPVDQRTDAQKTALLDLYLAQADPPSLALVNQQKALLAEKSTIEKRGSTTLVMEEKPGDAFAHILERGEYTLERDKVLAAIPDVFNFDPGDRKLSRQDLADWLVSKENPLTARVTVNRLWYYFFGRGIVETTEDFGIMGSQPTHPKLLDYLAVELIESGWDLQHVIKLITSSATYQQSQTTNSANREKDSENVSLWRAPRFRLEAEQIRDLTLASSGLLVRKVGGPSVKPYQPDGIWAAVAMNQSNTRNYKQDEGEGLYRRSLYTIWKRTAAPPNMEILDAPSREVFCVRRESTNTPLAAFVTMNDTQYVEAARVLASKALKVSPSFSQRLDLISMSLMSRTMNNEEQAVVKKALDHHLAHYKAKPELADQLIQVGNSATDDSLEKTELAAWTLIASQIFNLDETLTK